MKWLNFWQQSPPSPIQPIHFEFEVVETQLLGKIARPVAHVLLWSDVEQSWQKVKMLVDTGADYTLLPRYMGLWFEQERNKSNERVTFGLGGEQKIHFLNDIKVQVGGFERLIPLGIATTSKIPPLMGRHLFFETFLTVFDRKERVSFSD